MEISLLPKPCLPLPPQWLRIPTQLNVTGLKIPETCWMDSHQVYGHWSQKALNHGSCNYISLVNDLFGSLQGQSPVFSNQQFLHNLPLSSEMKQWEPVKNCTSLFNLRSDQSVTHKLNCPTCEHERKLLFKGSFQHLCLWSSSSCLCTDFPSFTAGFLQFPFTLAFLPHLSVSTPHTPVPLLDHPFKAVPVSLPDLNVRFLSSCSLYLGGIWRSLFHKIFCSGLSWLFTLSLGMCLHFLSWYFFFFPYIINTLHIAVS